jgi:hypothetical protein
LVTNVKKLFFIFVVAALVLSVATPFIVQPVKAATKYVYFYGPYNEALGGSFKYADGSNATCLVTVHLNYANTTRPSYVDSFNISWATPHTFSYSDTEQPLYFEYTITDKTTTPYTTYTRQYWYTASDDSSERSFYVYFGSNEQTYTVSFMDYTGLLKTYPYIEICYNIDTSSNYIVQKYKVDMQGVVVAELRLGAKYSIYFQDGSHEKYYYYGDLTPSTVTGIQLVIRGIDFPKETLLLYQYVHTSVTRDFLNPTGAITLNYEDINEQTTSVNMTITNTTSGLIVDQEFRSGEAAQTISYTWSAADNATSYQVTFIIDHTIYGTFYYKEYLLGEHAKASEPFSLDFLGTGFPISTAVLIPALLIIFVAGCFSELTSEAAAVLTVIVAILLTALGFIDIGQGAIISALALAVMAGIVTARKRMQYG